MQSPIFWGVLCGGIYFLVMWWIRTQRLNQQRRAARALYALSEEIVEAGSPAGIAAKLADSLPHLMEASGAHLFLWDKEAQRLRRAAGHGAESLEEAVAACFRNRTPLAVPDTRKNSLIRKTSEPLPRSALLVPVIAHDEALGVLEIDRADRTGVFAPEDQAAAQHVANQIASALKLQEQQALREQLFRGEKMAAAGQMIAGISAELRAPSEVISRLAAELTETLKRRDNLPAVEAGVAKVNAEAKRVRDIVLRLTAFTREANAAPKHLDLTGMLQRLAEYRAPLWAEHGLEVQRHWNSGAPNVLGAEPQLEQVLLTLLLDVERRAESGPHRSISLRAAETSGQVRVEIGQVLPPGVEPQDSEPDAISAEVCRSIAEAHGGELRVHRRAGIFAYELLLPGVHRTAEEPSAPAAAPIRPLTLMLVDHEPGAARPLMKMLSARGHRVVPVAGEAAVDVAPRLHFDAVFWTARPGRGGWNEFLDRVRSSIGSFVLISDGYSPDLASSLERNGGFLLARPVEEKSLDRILGEIGGQAVRNESKT